MGSIAEMVASGGRVSVSMAERMLKDVRPQQFARKPAANGCAVETNHPAFIYGHLALYPAMLMEMCGLDAAPAATPAAYPDLFGAGKACRDDPEGTIYPPMAEITSAFFGAYRALLAQLPSVSDERLGSPNPLEGRMREMFPTVGGMVMFMLTSHPMMHLGQASAWRRCMGLGPAM